MKKKVFLTVFGALSSLTFANDKILVVMSGVDYVTLKGKVPPHPTGYFQSELTTAGQMLTRAGYQLVFANPTGKEPAKDLVSESKQWFESEQGYQESLAFLERMRKESNLRKPLLLSSLSEEKLSEFSGMFLPGGHAPMEDLVKDRSLGKILEHFHSEDKMTGAICHAPVALLAAALESNTWVYEDYRIAVFSNEEEKIEEEAGHLHPRGMKGTKGYLTYYVADALRSQSRDERNITHAKEGPWKSHFERDRELVTAQNPFSDRAFGSAMLEVLTDRKLRKVDYEKWNGNVLAVETLIEVSAAPDWTKGYTTLYIGKRKADKVKDLASFGSRLAQHLSLVQNNMSAKGMKGYVIYYSENNEIAYQNWESEAAFMQAMATTEGQAVAKDAGDFMDLVLFTGVDSRYPASWLNR